MIGDKVSMNQAPIATPLTAVEGSQSSADERQPEVRGGKRSQTVRVFNLRLAAATLVVVAVLGPSLYAWHAHEVQRTAGAFVERADQLEKDKDWMGAAGYLHRYLRLCPDDGEVRVRMAKMYDRGATDWALKREAVNIYYDTLGRIPATEQVALRRRLAELLMDIGRFAAAEAEAMKVLAVDGKDFQGRRLLALASYAQVQSGTAVDRPKGSRPLNQAFEAAVQANPGDIQLSTILARIYRGDEQLLDRKSRALPRAEREKQADRLVDQMVRANPTKPDAYLARYGYRTQYGLPGAEDDLGAALKHGSNNSAVLLVAADQARRIARTSPSDRASSLAKARSHGEHILELAPGDERGYVLLGDIHWESNSRELAVETWRRGLKKANGQSIALHQRLAAALVALGQPDEAAQVLDTLDELLRKYGSLLPSGERAVMERFRDSQRAKWWWLKGDAAHALPLLQAVAAQGTSPAEAAQSSEAWVLLGGIWAARGEWDQAAAAYDQALLLQPHAAAVWLLSARAWANAGRYEMAERSAGQALAIDDAAETRFFLANACYQHQLRLPPEQRKWESFRKAFAEAAATGKQMAADPWRLSVLEAGALLAGATDKPAEEARRDAARLLRAAETEHPNSAGLCQLLPSAFEQVKCPADADRAMLKLASLPGQAFPAALCRCRVLMLRKQYAEARDTLQAALKSFPEKQPLLHLALISVNMAEGRTDEAYRELTRLQAKYPDNLPLLRQWMELAADLGKSEDCARCEEMFRQQEGPDGSWWRYYRAQRLLAGSRDAKDQRFQEAEKLVEELRTRRPFWPPTYRLCGLVANRRGDLDQAIEAYKNAIRFGDQRMQVYERLIETLYAQRRFSEAAEYLEQFQQQVPLSAGLSGVEISLAAQAGQLDRALTAARRGAEKRPKDPMAQIWLGHVLLVDGRKDEAEQAFQRAVALGPVDVRTHNALLTFYLRTNQPELAAKTLENLPRQVELPAAERAFVLAQGYELIGNSGKQGAKYLERADAEYKKAQELSPDRVAVLQRRAAFLVNRDPAAAEGLLRRILALDQRSIAARRMLAALLHNRGGENAWQESQQLLETSAADDPTLDRRLQAVLLVSRGGNENLAKARDILEKLVGGASQSVPGDHLLLARLLDAEDKTAPARQQYLAVVNGAAPDPAHLALYVDFLLRHDASAEAAPWLAKLEQRLPEDFGVIALRVRWLHQQRKDAEIGPKVEGLAAKLSAKLPQDAAKRATAESRLSLEVGNLYATVEQYPLAEQWYRRLLQADARQFGPLAMVLGRQNRLREAAELCTTAAKTDHTARPATVLAGILSAAHPTDDESRRAEPLLAQALASYPKDADLLSVVAGARIVQQRINEAIELYRRVVSLRPKDLGALNNLATLLGEQPEGRKEALHSIDEAIRLAGRLPPLLDTKATILLYEGRPEEAVPLLMKATQGASADSRFFFHLALALDRVGKPDEARTALKKALACKLAEQVLTAVELRLLKELEQKHGL